MATWFKVDEGLPGLLADVVIKPVYSPHAVAGVYRNDNFFTMDGVIIESGNVEYWCYANQPKALT